MFSSDIGYSMPIYTIVGVGIAIRVYVNSYPGEAWLDLGEYI